jgi:hypothetical protein
MVYTLNKSLKGIAHDWWVLIKHPGITLEDFKEKFINEFWGPHHGAWEECKRSTCVMIKTEPNKLLIGIPKTSSNDL